MSAGLRGTSRRLASSGRPKQPRTDVVLAVGHSTRVGDRSSVTTGTVHVAPVGVSWP
jgi:hypothetical protein